MPMDTLIQNTPRIEESSDLIDWIHDRSNRTDLFDSIQQGYPHDLTFKRLLENPTQFKHFELRNGLIYLKESCFAYQQIW